MRAAADGIEPPPGGGAGAGWSRGGLEVGGWSQDPGSKKWTSQPVGAGSEDAYVYTYDLACGRDFNDYDIACRAKQRDCNGGENGELVQWYRALKETDPPIWEPLGALTCIYSNKPIDVADEVAKRILEEFRRLPIQSSQSGAQPAPHTLRGANTNFYAEGKRQDFSLTLVGQKVWVKAYPATYRWEFGDGGSLGPVGTSGAPLPVERWGEETATSHVYVQTGDYRVLLTTYFRGDYRVNDGPWLTIPGEAEIASPPLQISVWRSITRNYADNCIENPQGAGC